MCCERYLFVARWITSALFPILCLSLQITEWPCVILSPTLLIQRIMAPIYDPGSFSPSITVLVIKPVPHHHHHQTTTIKYCKWSCLIFTCPPPTLHHFIITVLVYPVLSGPAEVAASGRWLQYQLNKRLCAQCEFFYSCQPVVLAWICSILRAL